jgi:hypothetical protein
MPVLCLVLGVKLEMVSPEEDLYVLSCGLVLGLSSWREPLASPLLKRSLRMRERESGAN